MSEVNETTQEANASQPEETHAVETHSNEELASANTIKDKNNLSGSGITLSSGSSITVEPETS